MVLSFYYINNHKKYMNRNVVVSFKFSKNICMFLHLHFLQVDASHVLFLKQFNHVLMVCDHAYEDVPPLPDPLFLQLQRSHHCLHGWFCGAQSEYPKSLH